MKHLKATSVTILCILGVAQFFIFIRIWCDYIFPIIGCVIVCGFVVLIVVRLYIWALDLFE